MAQPFNGRSRKLFVGSLPHNIHESLVRTEFSRYGQVEDVYVKPGCEPTRQFAFVTFTTPEEAQRAKEATDRVVHFPGATGPANVMIARNQGQYGQMPTDPTRPNPSPGGMAGPLAYGQPFGGMGQLESQAPKKILVGSLPEWISEAELRHAFSTYGQIIDLHLNLRPVEPSRQWCLITYAEPSQAQYAKSSADRVLIFPGSEKPCEVIFARYQGEGGAPGGGGAPGYAGTPTAPNSLMYGGGMQTASYPGMQTAAYPPGMQNDPSYGAYGQGYDYSAYGGQSTAGYDYNAYAGYAPQPAPYYVQPQQGQGWGMGSMSTLGMPGMPAAGPAWGVPAPMPAPAPAWGMPAPAPAWGVPAPMPAPAPFPTLRPVSRPASMPMPEPPAYSAPDLAPWPTNKPWPSPLSGLPGLDDANIPGLPGLDYVGLPGASAPTPASNTNEWTAAAATAPAFNANAWTAASETTPAPNVNAWTAAAQPSDPAPLRNPNTETLAPAPVSSFDVPGLGDDVPGLGEPKPAETVPGLGLPGLDSEPSPAPSLPGLGPAGNEDGARSSGDNDARAPDDQAESQEANAWVNDAGTPDGQAEAQEVDDARTPDGQAEAQQASTDAAPAAEEDQAPTSEPGVDEVQAHDEGEPAADDPAPSAASKKVYVGSLPEDVTEDILAEEFTKYGKVSDIHINNKPAASGSNWAFVTFDTPEEAKRAKDATDGTLVLPNADGPCEVMIAKTTVTGKRPRSEAVASLSPEYDGLVTLSAVFLAGFMAALLGVRLCARRHKRKTGRRW